MLLAGVTKPRKSSERGEATIRQAQLFHITHASIQTETLKGKALDVLLLQENRSFVCVERFLPRSPLIVRVDVIL